MNERTAQLSFFLPAMASSSSCEGVGVAMYSISTAKASASRSLTTGKKTLATLAASRLPL
jgi:hypothetical protein